MNGVPSQNLEAEENVLGAMILAPAAIDSVREHVRAEDFYRESHGIIFGVVSDMHDRQLPVDAVTLVNELERVGKLEAVGGKARCHELMHMTVATSNAAHHAKIVREQAVLRGLSRAGVEIAKLGSGDVSGSVDELLAEAEKQLSKAQDSLQAADAAPLTEGLDDLFAAMRRVIQTGIPEVGDMTGFTALDDVLQGLWEEQLIIIAARTGEGKSTLALNIAENYVDRDDDVLFVSLEMSRRELQVRSLAREAKVDSKLFLSGILKDNPTMLAKVKTGKERVEQRTRLHVEPSGYQTINSLRSLAIRYKRQHKIKLMVVDYLQLVTPPKAERHSLAIGEISRGLKLLAKQLGIPVIAVCQLNRDGAKGKPELWHLKESGSLEQDADVVIFLHDPAGDELNIDALPTGTVDVIVAKNRKGGRDTVKLDYIKKYSSFYNRTSKPQGSESE